MTKVIDTTDGFYEVSPSVVPEDQLHGFEAWIAIEDYYIEKFIVDVVPELLPLNFSLDAIEVLDRWIYENLTSTEYLSTDEGSERWGMAARYFGAVFIKHFEAEWVIPVTDGECGEPNVWTPYGLLYKPLRSIRRSVIARRQETFTFVTHYAEKRYGEWITSGRPSHLPSSKR